MQVGDIVGRRVMSGDNKGRNHVFSGRIIEKKILKYPFGEDIILYKVEETDGMKEWINARYLRKVDNK